MDYGEASVVVLVWINDGPHFDSEIDHANTKPCVGWCVFDVLSLLLQRVGAYQHQHHTRKLLRIRNKNGLANKSD